MCYWDHPSYSSVTRVDGVPLLPISMLARYIYIYTRTLQISNEFFRVGVRLFILALNATKIFRFHRRETKNASILNTMKWCIITGEMSTGRHNIERIRWLEFKTGSSNFGSTFSNGIQISVFFVFLCQLNTNMLYWSRAYLYTNHVCT